MAIELKNNAIGYLQSDINDSQTNIILQPGEGGLFPNVSGANYAFITIQNTNGEYEVVRLTGRSGDILTVKRAQEGTIALPFPKMSRVELRVTVGNIEGAIQDSRFVPSKRVGDAPSAYDLSGGAFTESTDGAVYQIDGTGRVEANLFISIEPQRLYKFRVAYRRAKDTQDPANDGVRAGVIWYNGFKNQIGTSVIVEDFNLSVTSGRKEFEEALGLPGTADVSTFAPESARYAKAFIETYGVGAETNIEVCRVEQVRELVLPQISADDITIPSDFEWPAGTIPAGAGTSSSYDTGNVIYVSITGNDTNSGLNPSEPKRTVNAGLSAAADNGAPCVVIVNPGEYEVDPDTEIPVNCALYGYDLRVTKLKLPDGFEENNMFLMTSGIKVRGFTFTNLRHEAPDDYTSIAAGMSATDNTDYFTVTDGSETLGYINDDGTAKQVNYPYPPEKGFVFVFKPDEVINRSPYIADCTAIHNLTYEQLTLPIDSDKGNPLMPRGLGNILADGSILAPSTPLRSVVVDSFTAVNPNGVGYLVKRNAFVQLVSVFTNWSRVGLWAHYGGQFTVANSNNTFGDFSLVSTEARQGVKILDQAGEPRGIYNDMAQAILDDFDDIRDEVYNQLASEFTEVQNFTQENEDLTRRDLATLLRQLRSDLRSGLDRNSRFFVKGFFNWNGEYFFDSSLLNIFLRSYEITEDRINARGPFQTGAAAMLASLITMIKDNLETPTFEAIPSSIEANSQQFSYAGTGVNFLALPFDQRGTGDAPDPLRTIIEINGGRVYATFSTQDGDTYLGGGIRVDFDRGVIEGSSFSRGTQDITLPLIVALGG